ncbi:MAG: methyltransferase domain-containing protein [Rhizobiaceae bacterium]|nr:methyltransferase domain-containing protein [Rhizobiaceae bacterium]
MQNVQDRAYTGLASDYRKARPTYPAEMAKAIAAFAGDILGPGATVVDVGAGTGISTFAILSALPSGTAAVGIEPNADMRAQAMAATPAGLDTTFIAGAADDLKLGDEEASMVTTGQAIQWFDRPKFYAEVARVLRPGGVLAVFENNRDWQRSGLLEEHETFLETHAVRGDGSRYSRFYRDHPYAQELFRLFGNVVASQFTWTREMTVDDFVTMAKSSTQVQAAISQIGEDGTVQSIRGYCEKYANASGLLQIPYVTELYLTAKTEPQSGFSGD